MKNYDGSGGKRVTTFPIVAFGKSRLLNDPCDPVLLLFVACKQLMSANIQ
jgi:hypothetical protein